MNLIIREMTEQDYDGVNALWRRIKGFGIRSMDDTKEGVLRFLERNPHTSVVAVDGDNIVGSVLCGHDGRQACFYHVCVDESYRLHGIGKRMVAACVDALKKEKINRVYLIAFKKNKGGNAFWKKIGYQYREDRNYYELYINEKNQTIFND